MIRVNTCVPWVSWYFAKQDEYWPDGDSSRKHFTLIFLLSTVACKGILNVTLHQSKSKQRSSPPEISFPVCIFIRDQMSARSRPCNVDLASKCPARSTVTLFVQCFILPSAETQFQGKLGQLRSETQSTDDSVVFGVWFFLFSRLHT